MTYIYQYKLVVLTNPFLQCMIQNELLLALTANHVPCEMVKQNFITALYVNVGVTLKFHLHLFNIY